MRRPRRRYGPTPLLPGDALLGGSWTLTITKAGAGASAGTVADNREKIACGATCSASYVDQNIVTLTATPGPGSTFTGWSGAASGTTNPINVVMDGNKSVTATFS